jgi:hypothetical protein
MSPASHCRGPGSVQRCAHFGERSATAAGFSLRTSVFPLPIIIPPLLHIHLSSGAFTIGPFEATVPRDCPTPFLQPLTSYKNLFLLTILFLNTQYISYIYIKSSDSSGLMINTKGSINGQEIYKKIYCKTGINATNISMGNC